MTIHEQTTQSEIVRAQIELLNDTLAMTRDVYAELSIELGREILRLSKLIK